MNRWELLYIALCSAEIINMGECAIEDTFLFKRDSCRVNRYIKEKKKGMQEYWKRYSVLGGETGPSLGQVA